MKFWNCTFYLPCTKVDLICVFASASASPLDVLATVFGCDAELLITGSIGDNSKIIFQTILLISQGKHML